MEPEDHYIAEMAGGLQAVDSGVTSIVDYAHCADTDAKVMAAAQGLKDSGIGGYFAFQLGRSTPPIKLGDTVDSLEIFGGGRRATEEQWDTAERLQQDLFNDRSAPLQLALARALGTGSPIDEIRDDWARVRSTGVDLLVGHMHKPNPNRRYPAGVMGAHGFGSSGSSGGRFAWPRLSCGTCQPIDSGRAANVQDQRLPYRCNHDG